MSMVCMNSAWVRPPADDAHLDTILQVPTGKPVETVNPGADIEIIARSLAVDGKVAKVGGVIGILTVPH